MGKEMKIGIFYGSSSGNTANAAKVLKAELDLLGQVDLGDIADTEIALLADYDLVILGSSTWGLGDLQDDWYGKEALQGVDLTGKKAAVFGAGDQSGFGDTFVDAIGVLAGSAEKAGATLIGKWPTDGYDFSGSVAVNEEGFFAGLALDDDNQPDLTIDRIKQWAAQLKSEI